MKEIYKPINRFPMVYRMQAQKAIDYAVRDTVRVTADAFIMASVLALIEEFDFGTKEQSTRIPRFIAKLQDVIDTNADFYDDAIAEGLKNKLHNYGIEYDLRGDK